MHDSREDSQGAEGKGSKGMSSNRMPARSPSGALSHPFFWLGGFSLTKIDHRKKVGALILSSLLEDLAMIHKHLKVKAH